MSALWYPVGGRRAADFARQTDWEKSYQNGDAWRRTGLWRCGRRAKEKLKPDTLKRVSRTFAPYAGQIALVVLCVFAAAGFGLATPFFLRKIIDIVW